MVWPTPSVCEQELTAAIVVDCHAPEPGSPRQLGQSSSA
jgi:hypothetical protein